MGSNLNISKNDYIRMMKMISSLSAYQDGVYYELQPLLSQLFGFNSTVLWKVDDKKKLIRSYYISVDRSTHARILILFLQLRFPISHKAKGFISQKHSFKTRRYYYDEELWKILILQWIYEEVPLLWWDGGNIFQAD